MKIVIFDTCRLSFEAGAEKYFTEVGEEYGFRGNEVFYVGDFRLAEKIYLWVSFFLNINPLSKLPIFFNQLKKAPPLRPSEKPLITHIPLRLTSFLFFLKERSKLKNLLEEADLILIKNEIPDLLLFCLLDVQNPKKYVIVFTPIQYPESNTIRTKFHNFFYLSRLNSILINKIGRVIVSNRRDERLFLHYFGLGKDWIFNIPYGLNSHYFPKSTEFISHPSFQVFFAGRIEEQKGIYYLEKILRNINLTSWGKKIEFAVAGNGPMENVLQSLSVEFENIKHLGWVASDKIRSLYLCSDLVIMTSKWESFPYVCVEAQACGCPVVAFDIPGPADIIEKKSGLLVPLGNIDKFQKAIHSYFLLKLRNRKKYLALRSEIAFLSAQKYDISMVVDNLDRLIQNK